MNPTETLVKLGRYLMEKRGMSPEELNGLMLSILAVCSKMISEEGELLVRQAIAQAESKDATKQ